MQKAFIFLLLLVGSFGHAGLEIISTRTETAKLPNNCESHQSCDLKGIKFVEYKKTQTVSADPAKYAIYYTDTRFAYQVPSPLEIEKFGIVQLIRGCMFSSRLENGSVKKYLNIYRDFMGKQVPFQHKIWQADTDSLDPIYSSYPGSGRFALLRWNKDQSVLNAETSIWYAKQKPNHGSVFVTDLPGGAFLSSDNISAQNTSLEFKTCLFPINEIPNQTDEEIRNIDLKKALWCVDWDHKFTWDFVKDKMASNKAIDPICAVKN